jgi:CHASE2 domain-containing sensor protein
MCRRNLLTTGICSSKALLIQAGILALIGLSIENCSATPEKAALEGKTAFVVIDDASTALIGEMPIDRSVVANAIQILKVAGAKAVAIKFFYDSNKSSDEKLVEAMKELPVLLQYVLVNDGKDQIPTGRETLRFSAVHLVDGKADMVPNSVLRSHMTDMGFVNEQMDAGTHSIVMVGQSLRNPAASLQLEILEKVAGSRASIEDGQLNVNGQRFKLDDKGRVPCDFLTQGKPHAIPIMDVLNQNFDKRLVSGKVVVIGYGRQDSPTISTSSFGKMPIHEYFYRQVVCVSNLVQ